MKDAEFTITNLGPNPVLVDGTLYEKDQVVLTLKTDEKGLASTKKDTLPYGHYRIDEHEMESLVGSPCVLRRSWGTPIYVSEPGLGANIKRSKLRSLALKQVPWSEPTECQASFL